MLPKPAAAHTCQVGLGGSARPDQHVQRSAQGGLPPLLPLQAHGGAPQVGHLRRLPQHTQLWLEAPSQHWQAAGAGHGLQPAHCCSTGPHRSVWPRAARQAAVPTHRFAAGGGSDGCGRDAQEGPSRSGGDAQRRGHPPEQGLQQLGPPGAGAAAHALRQGAQVQHRRLPWQLRRQAHASAALQAALKLLRVGCARPAGLAQCNPATSKRTAIQLLQGSGQTACVTVGTWVHSRASRAAARTAGGQAPS